VARVNLATMDKDRIIIQSDWHEALR